MNIKNPETEELARELAALTGESMTSAITIALRERHERVLADRGARAEQMRALSRESARRIPHELKNSSHGDILYDANGLPR